MKAKLGTRPIDIAKARRTCVPICTTAKVAKLSVSARQRSLVRFGPLQGRRNRKAADPVRSCSHADGARPAPGVIIYAHQTNAAGLYANGSNLTEWSHRHGRLRGWVKTGADGRYEFLTIKPAPYPNRTIPAHIHLFVGEPGRRPYYIDDVVFDGEFGVAPAYRSAQELRGGSGIIRLQRQRTVR